jgi:hypothetical protein
MSSLKNQASSDSSPISSADGEDFISKSVKSSVNEDDDKQLLLNQRCQVQAAAVKTNPTKPKENSVVKSRGTQTETSVQAALDIVREIREHQMHTSFENVCFCREALVLKFLRMVTEMGFLSDFPTLLEEVLQNLSLDSWCG